MGIRSIVDNMDPPDPFGVLLFSLITIVLLGSISLLYVTHQHDLKSKAFTQVCVDAGGVPVITYNYVKGSKDGHLCINPSAIIEVN